MHLSNKSLYPAFAIGLFFILTLLSPSAQLQTEQLAATQPVPPVKLNVLVLDDSKHAVNDVTQNEFRAFEDDVEQKITFFSKEPLPLSCGLVIDTSGSMRSQMDNIIETARDVVNAMRPEDETFVLRFVDNANIDILQDFTSNKNALDRSLDELYPQGGQTALIDAVFLAAMHMAKGKKDTRDQSRRRALILISDGEDRKSTSKAETLFDFLRKKDIQIYVIGLVSMLEDNRVTGLGQKATRGKSIELLNRLAEETGGRAFFPKSPADFSEVVTDIMRDLRTQYVLGYTPPPNSKSKAYRNVTVKIERAKGGEKRTVVARPGYVLPVK